MRSRDTSLWFGGEKKAEAVTPRGGGDSLAFLPSFLWTWSNGPQAEQAACGVEEASQVTWEWESQCWSMEHRPRTTLGPGDWAP